MLISVVGACSFDESVVNESCTSGVVYGDQVCRDGGWHPRPDGGTGGEVVESGDMDAGCDGAIEEGCPCDYDADDDGTGESAGVCADVTTIEGGSCGEPDDFEQTETSCEDGADNDCDGQSDHEDSDCPSVAGTPCSADTECLSGVCQSTTGSGVCAHRIFVSSNQYNGDFGGLGGADTVCNSLAVNADLTGIWRAVMSDGDHDARDRIAVEANIVRIDGEAVADGEADLWDGTIANPIKIDENGTAVPTCSNCESDRVWTGTDDDGTVRPNTCADWKDVSPTGSSGDPGDTGRRQTGDWIHEDAGPEACGDEQRIYCIDGQ